MKIPITFRQETSPKAIKHPGEGHSWLPQQQKETQPYKFSWNKTTRKESIIILPEEASSTFCETWGWWKNGRNSHTSTEDKKRESRYRVRERNHYPDDEQVKKAAPRDRNERTLSGMLHWHFLKSVQGFDSAGKTEWQVRAGQNFRRMHFKHYCGLKTQWTEFKRFSSLYMDINPKLQMTRSLFSLVVSCWEVTEAFPVPRWLTVPSLQQRSLCPPCTLWRNQVLHHAATSSASAAEKPLGGALAPWGQN